MSTNLAKLESRYLDCICTHPAAPNSNDPVRVGNTCGVAKGDEATTGNLNGYTPVDFSGVYDLSVKGIDDDGNSAVSDGDKIYYVDADTPVLSKKESGVLFGYAYRGVGDSATLVASGATTTIKVRLHAGFAPSDILQAQTIDGTQFKNVADDNVIGGATVLHRIDITAGALGDTDVTLTHKTRVVDAWLILRGAGVATTTLQVKNGANAITDAMAASGSDTDLVRAATIDDANHEIAAAGTLRVTSATGATQPDATVYVLGVRVA